MNRYTFKFIINWIFKTNNNNKRTGKREREKREKEREKNIYHRDKRGNRKKILQTE